MNIEEYIADNEDQWDIDAGLHLVDHSIDDIEEWIHYRPGANDSHSWLMVFRLKDGRYAYVTAWCDYTGWGCQDGADISYADSPEALVPEMDTEGRMAFGYEDTPDCGI